MNQSRKILMLAAILIVVVGAVMVIGAMALGKTNLKEVAGLSYTMKTFEIQDQFTGISVEDTECRVRILHTEDDGCTVICSEKEDGSVYHTVMVTDGVLMIQRHDERQWFQRIGIFLDVETVDIYLPEKEYGQLVAHSVAGSIQVAEELRAETTSGRVTIEGEFSEGT